MNKQGTLFEIGSAREASESQSQQEEALKILRCRKLTKTSFEQDWQKNGCRLAPAIDILRNGWGFEIAGQGTSTDPYWLLNPNQSPTKVRTTDSIKARYYESEHWKSLRERRFQFDDYRCVVCVESCKESIECHHIEYNLFEETLEELMTVCKLHHEKIHKNSAIKFPTGVDVWVAERLLEVAVYKFEDWLLP